MEKQAPINPLYKVLVDTVGVDYYEAKWKSLSSVQRFWYTVRGFNPGGRKGAPPLRREANGN